MPRILNLLRPTRSAAIVGLCLATALFGSFDGQAQQCNVQVDPSAGGIIEAQTSTGLLFDAELEIEIAPDLSTVRLENSIIRAVYKTLPEPPEYSIKNFVIKSADEDQLEGFGFMDAGAGLGPLESATMVVDRPDRKTVRMVWCSRSIPDSIVNCGKQIIKEVTIYPHQPYLEINNIDIQWQGNYADLGLPGGVLTGVHAVHGSDDWIRPFSYHDDDPSTSKGAYYTRFIGDGILDPADGGSLNYNGHFIVAVFNPSNGRGWGRVSRVEDTEIIKLLMTEARSQGIEFFHYPFIVPHSQPFKTYIYAVRDGYNDALPTGRLISDLGNSQPEIACGDTLDLTAIPYTNWQFDGWTGSLAGVTESDTSVQLSGDFTVGADFSPSAADYADNFDAANLGDDPAQWFDTGEANSLLEDDSLFKVFDYGSDRVFGTLSGAANIHSHYTGPATDSVIGYEWSGRMLMTDPRSGIGVTIFSGFPNDTSYYRLRRFDAGAFHLTANGTTISGYPDTGVVPVADAWYQFRFQAENATDRTWIRAKVWKDGFPEPSSWQVEVFDDSVTRLQGGAAGLWAYSVGTKYVDDLAIRALSAPRTDIVLTVNTVGSGNVVVTPDQGQYTTGEVVTLEGVGAAGEIFDGWGGALAGFQNPRQLMLVDDATVTAFFEATTTQTLTKTVNGQGTITVTPDLPEYPLGDVIELTATPAQNWYFTGWSGDLTTTNNSSFFLIEGDVAVTANFAESQLMEDFEGVPVGGDPSNWWDTMQNDSLVQNDSLFTIQSVGGTQALSTSSTLVNIHSHHIGPELQNIDDYRFSGRMRFDNATGGTGVTFFSQFPAAADYYRLRVVPDGTFTLTPIGGRNVTGVTDTGVAPVAGNWYRFEIEVEDTGIQTDIRAKVWLDGDSEPVDWQAVAYDDAADRLTSGTVGVWSMAAGNKYWDEFEVVPLPPPPPIYTLDTPVVGNGSVIRTPDAPLYAMGDVVSLEAIPNPDHVFTGWSGDVTSTSTPLGVTVFGNTSVTATFVEIQYFPLTLSTTGDGSGSIVANPDQPTYVLGETVTLTAVPGAGSYFGGWSGDTGGGTNPIELAITGPTSVSADFGVGLYAHDFEGLDIGNNPVDWFDTGADNSLSQVDYLFNVQPVGTGQAFTTTSPATNIHSHYVGAGASALTGYRYSGRMQMTSGNSGLGVTFLSQYPTLGTYYRLRRYGGTSFHLSPVETSITSGTDDTGVVPVPNLWYRFVVEVEDTGTETQIRAKVWEEQSTEPTEFQIEAVDDSLTRLTSGTFGVWASGSGTKHWDELVVESLTPIPVPVPALGGGWLALLLTILLGAGSRLGLRRGPAARH